MFELEFEGATYRAAAGETVLDTLLRHSVCVPYSCRKGVCQTCLLKSEDIAVPADAQRGLRVGLRERGVFLACQCTPQRNMRLARADAAQSLGRAVVIAKDMLAPQICRLRLQLAQPVQYRAGQFVNLRRDEQTGRSYSLASVPDLDRFLEVHVKRHAGGTMSGWIFDVLGCGMQVELLGPLGECHYRPGNSLQPMLLIGTGTGLAPLMGIARDALQSGHRGVMHLYHGVAQAHDLYARRALEALAVQYENFHFHACVSAAGPVSGCVSGRASDVAFRDHRNLSGWSVFLCGSPPMVHAAKKMAYLLGAQLSDIHADPFELKDLRHSERGEHAAA